MTKAQGSKKIPLDRIDAITISQSDMSKSDEFIIHMKNGYDHRYHAGRLRDTVVDLLRRLRKKISTEAIEGAKDNIYVKLD